MWPFDAVDDTQSMMFSTITLEHQIEEKKFFIKLMVESWLVSMHPGKDAKLVLAELEDIRSFEADLRKLEERKQ